MYQWRANSRMRLCESESVHFAHARIYTFSFGAANLYISAIFLILPNVLKFSMFNPSPAVLNKEVLNKMIKTPNNNKKKKKKKKKKKDKTKQKKNFCKNKDIVAKN